MHNDHTFEATAKQFNKGKYSNMRAIKKKSFNNDWEFEQEKRQEKKRHKAFRDQRKNRKVWEEVADYA